MTTRELISRIAEKTNYTKKDISTVVNELFTSIEESLVEGEPVKLYHFGQFVPYHTEARVKIDPRNCTKVNVPAQMRVKFVASETLKRIVKEGRLD